MFSSPYGVSFGLIVMLCLTDDEYYYVVYDVTLGYVLFHVLSCR